jgi:hypothetical protein
MPVAVLQVVQILPSTTLQDTMLYRHAAQWPP